MAVDFFVNVLNTPHFPIFRAGNDCPAVVFSGGASGAAAGSKIGAVPLVDVRGGVGVLLPVAQQLLRKIRGDVQIQRQIRAGKPQPVVFEFVQPPEKFLTLLLRLLGRLMDGVGGGVAVADYQTALFVPLPPDLFVGGVAVDGIKGGSGVGVDILRIRAKLPTEIHPNQRGAGFGILGKDNFPKGNVFVFQTLGQQTKLGGLAGAVRALNDD